MQIRHKLASTSLTLPRDGAIAFNQNGAIVAADFPTEQLASLPTRAVIINPSTELAHPQNPKVVDKADFELLVFVEDVTNRFGQRALYAMNVLTQLITDTIGIMEQELGVRVICVRKSIARPAPLKTKPLLYRAMTFQARNLSGFQSGNRFPPVTSFAAGVAGPTVTLTWTRPTGYSVRYDYRGVIVRRKAGSAPTSITDGTSVMALTDAATVNNSPGAGTWYYAAFVVYDEAGEQLNSDVSAAASTTATV